MDKFDTVVIERTEPAKTSSGRKSALRGVHHLALNTDDLRMTLDFYTKVLGLPLIGGLLTGANASASSDTKGNPPFNNMPHYFLDMGGDSTLAFFEYPKGSVPKGDRNTIAAMQHVSFACSPSRYKEVEQRLRDHGVEIVAGPFVLVEPNIQSFYFFDPNGIRLEITSDMGGDEVNLDVVGSFTLTREAMRRELRTISDDEAWIEEMIDQMPDPNPRIKRDHYHG